MKIYQKNADNQYKAVELSYMDILVGLMKDVTEDFCMPCDVRDKVNSHIKDLCELLEDYTY